MSAKEKTRPGVPAMERQKEIERLEKDVEELRHLAGDEEADAELERIRHQVAELRREFYVHLGPWQRAQIARHQQRPYLLDLWDCCLRILWNCTATAVTPTTKP